MAKLVDWCWTTCEIIPIAGPPGLSVAGQREPPVQDWDREITSRPARRWHQQSCFLFPRVGSSQYSAPTSQCFWSLTDLPNLRDLVADLSNWGFLFLVWLLHPVDFLTARKSRKHYWLKQLRTNMLRIYVIFVITDINIIYSGLWLTVTLSSSCLFLFYFLPRQCCSPQPSHRSRWWHSWSPDSHYQADIWEWSEPEPGGGVEPVLQGWSPCLAWGRSLEGRAGQISCTAAEISGETLSTHWLGCTLYTLHHIIHSQYYIALWQLYH